MNRGTIIALIFGGWYMLMLYGCAKSASETATEAALHQTQAVYQQVKKECPTAKIDESIAALQATIKSQLAACESEKGKLRERNNTLIVILIGILAVLGVANWAKLKARFIK